jgi:hypothetical protein
MIERFETTAFESLNINLSSPISPMPLPEDTADSNLLVKMEGNTKQIRFSCKFDSNLITLAQNTTPFVESKLKYRGTNINVDENTDGTIIYEDNSETNNVALVALFTEKFESRSITDSFYFRVYDTTSTADNKALFEGTGSITSIDTSVDSSSPVVWTVNIDFIVGDVISIYDADTPDEVDSLEITSSASGELQFVWKDPTRVGGTAVTSFMLEWQNNDTNDKQYETLDYTESRVVAEGVFDSATGKYTRVISGSTSAGVRVNFTTIIPTVGAGVDAGYVVDSGTRYTCYVTARNTGGSGVKSDSIIVKAQ